MASIQMKFMACLGGGLLSIGVGIGLWEMGKSNGYEQGVRASNAHQIKSAGDLNNDGVDDLVTYDDKGQKVVYICRENDADACISQDWYLANVKTEMDGKTQKKVDDLKKLIEENLKKFEQRGNK